MARTVAGTTGGRTNRKFLIVAVLFGALTAALFYALTARSSGSSGSHSAAAGDQQVVVAKIPIKQRTTITADMLEVKSVPLNTVIGGAFTQTTDAVGKVTKFPIDTNQQVVGSAVIDTAHPISDSALSLVVPTGRRAMSIQATQVLTAGGLVLPGDFVDIIWTCCSNPDRAIATKTLLRNVQVAAVAQSIIDAGPVAAGSSSGTSGAASAGQAPVAAGASKPLPDAVTLTLLLTPDEAQQVFMAELTGKLRADLRGVGDQDTPDPGLTLVTQLLPIDSLKSLPDVLKPDGYKPQ